MSATPSADIPQFEIDSGPGPDDVFVVRVAGEVDMSHEEELRRELRTAIAAEPNGIVVDLTECEFIDSSGVRAVLLSREAQNPDDGTEHLAVAAAERADSPHPLRDGHRPSDPDQADGRGSRARRSSG